MNPALVGAPRSAVSLRLAAVALLALGFAAQPITAQYFGRNKVQ